MQIPCTEIKRHFQFHGLYSAILHKIIGITRKLPSTWHLHPFAVKRLLRNEVIVGACVRYQLAFPKLHAYPILWSQRVYSPASSSGGVVDDLRHPGHFSHMPLRDGLLCIADGQPCTQCHDHHEILIGLGRNSSSDGINIIKVMCTYLKFSDVFVRIAFLLSAFFVVGFKDSLKQCLESLGVARKSTSMSRRDQVACNCREKNSDPRWDQAYTQEVKKKEEIRPDHFGMEGADKKTRHDQVLFVERRVRKSMILAQVLSS